jgi:hypothetical protein
VRPEEQVHRMRRVTSDLSHSLHGRASESCRAGAFGRPIYRIIFGRPIYKNHLRRCRRKPRLLVQVSERMVGERGFEPPTPWSRTSLLHRY